MTSEPCTVRAEHGDCGAHPSSEPNPWTGAGMIRRALAVAKALTYFGSLVATFDLKERIERGWGKRARAYNLAHPPPPGQQLGASWVAKRRQDIDE